MDRPALSALAFALLLVTGCGREQVEPVLVKASPKPAHAKPESKADPAPAPVPGLQWIDDDWAKAKAEAEARGVPIVADMWAPWCHTCLSMQQTVLADASLRRYASRFVWLAVDTDKADNAELMARLEMVVWPTFFILDPADVSVHGSFGGAASLAQFEAFLDDGEASYLDGHGQALANDDPRKLVRDGARAMQSQDYEAADAAYSGALTLAPEGWSRRPDVLVDLIRARYKGKRWQACAELGEARLDEVAESKSASLTDFSLYAGRCAEELGGDRGAALRRRLIEALVSLDAAPEHALSVDDRSDLLANLRELLSALGDEAGAREMAVRQRDLLATTWHHATPRAAMTYNWQRAEVAVFLGEGESVLADLEASANALPDEYDPPYRLAWVLLKLDRPDEALAWAERARAAMYGPREARAAALIADIHAAREDPEAERLARAAVVEVWESLPEGQRQPEALERAKAKLAALK